MARAFIKKLSNLAFYIFTTTTTTTREKSFLPQLIFHFTLFTLSAHWKVENVCVYKLPFNIVHFGFVDFSEWFTKVNTRRWARERIIEREFIDMNVHYVCNLTNQKWTFLNNALREKISSIIARIYAWKWNI